jgi:nucleoside-diphosphate-sugar epimerase
VRILITGGLGFIGSHLVNSLGRQHVIDIVDGFDENYVGYKFIHRGSRGLQETNDIEKKHRKLNLRYRVNHIKGMYRHFFKTHSYVQLPLKEYDLIINCGALSEAILSQHFPEFTNDSIVKGLESLKKFYPKTPVLHISSSMVYGTWEGVIDEQHSLGSENPYGVSKIKAEAICGEEDVILRPIHVYGMGDGKFPIWMNIERQVAINKPVLVEEAGCIYIDDFVIAIKNILDKWIPGTYNISYDFRRSAQALKNVYPESFETLLKAGPTGKPRGLLDCSKLKTTFNLKMRYETYEDTIGDYFTKHENFCSKQ